MNPTIGQKVPEEVRDLLANLRISDQQTNGQPELPSEQAQPARDWLCRILVDSRLLLAHLDLLQEFYGTRFDSPLPRRFLGEGGLAAGSLRQADATRVNGGEAPRGEGVTGFRHNGLLPEAEARAIAERGPDVLADTELATLLLNPLALWDVADLINALLPEYWLGRMDEVGRQLMEEYGLEVAIPGLPSDASGGGGVRPNQTRPGPSPSQTTGGMMMKQFRTRRPDLIEEFNRRRGSFLGEALKDAKKWCVKPETLVIPDHKRPDQLWLQLFSSDSETVTAGDMHRFLVEWGLTNRVKYDKEAVARRIMDLRQQGFSPIPEAVSELAKELRGYILSAKKGDQTSAASKIAFFTKPLQDVYIWDKFARLSARFRDPQSGRLNDYAPFHASCAKVLAHERSRDDFDDAVQEFRAFLRQEGGPMADSTILCDSSFVERRLLDKLMFWEGKWLAGNGKW